MSAAEAIAVTPNGRPKMWRLDDETICTHIALGSDYIQYAIDGAGRHLRFAQSPTLPPEHVAHYLIGMGMGIFLRVRGLLCLHASVVAYRDHAFLLMGGKGAGKSTTCATLAQLGCHPMSDDLAALEVQGSDYQVFPAYPYIRLRPEVASDIYSDSALTPHIFEVRNVTLVNKRYLNVEMNGLIYPRDPLPLAAIYHLDTRQAALEKPQIKPLSGLEKLQTLTANAVSPELFPEKHAADFAQRAALANAVPVRRVQRSDDLASVPQVAAAILADMTTLLKM